MEVREAAIKSYNSLPDGGKKKAASIYGVLGHNFKRLLVISKDEDTLFKALAAIRQAAENIKKDTDLKVKKVLEISSKAELKKQENEKE